MPKSPLTYEEIQAIENTGLPSLDKHHVRLLAHCLSCFKSMHGDSSSGAIPDQEVSAEWLLKQTELVSESDFLNVLLEQFASAGKQLELIAAHYKMTPMELTLELLIDFQRTFQGKI